MRSVAIDGGGDQSLRPNDRVRLTLDDGPGGARRSRVDAVKGPAVDVEEPDPTCARHGVQPRQLDMSARLIWLFEKLGWAADVRWPTPARLDRLLARADTSR